MTSKGRYVDRIEAMKIAYECGQVTKERALRNDDSNIKYLHYFKNDDIKRSNRTCNRNFRNM